MPCCDKPYINPPFVVPFLGFTEYTPVMPKMYWNVVSQEQRIHRLCETLDKLVCYSDMLGVKINVNRDDIDWLLDQFQQFKESGFNDYYEQQLEQWINDNAALLFTKLAKMVFFGLTPDGHFCAYIPESWQDITFDTGAVWGRSDYGRLILRYTSDNAYDNTYDYAYSDAQTLELEQAIADLETIIGRSDLCYDTLFTNLDEEV